MKLKTLSLLSLILLSTGCTFHSIDMVEIKNKEPESKYFVGNSSIENGDASSIDIRWISGKIFIEYGEDNKISFKEESEHNLTLDTTIHYWNDISKSVLYLTAAASGTYKSKELEKDLYISIPKDMKLSSLNIDCVSSEITSTIKYSECKIDSVSGNINMNSEDAGNLSVNNVSGNIDLSLFEFESIKVNTVSGNTSLKCKKDYPVNVSLNTLSGKKTLKGVTENDKGKVVEVDSVSGSLTISGELE